MNKNILRLLSLIIIKVQKTYNLHTYIAEDKIVDDFLNKVTDKNKYSIKMLEVGSGLGRYIKQIKNKYKKIDITCIEINKELAQTTRRLGIKTHVGSIVDYQFKKEAFNIIHCSHVIEHLGYPEIIKVLDNLFSYLKDKGFLVIRTPLMHDNFYLDIDHIRPYPPDTILNYYANLQQQVVGKTKIKEIVRWYRRPPLQIKFATNRLFVQLINSFLKICWIYFKYPNTKPDGYISIFQKI